MRAIGFAIAGVLMVIGAPLTASANGVSLTVTTGTTVYPPAVLDLGTGRSGAVLASDPLRVEWLSNDAGMAVSVIASDLRCVSPECEAAPHPDAIDAALVVVRQPGADVPLDGVRPLALIAGDTGHTREGATIELAVLLPQVRSGRYAATLSFLVVDPTSLPADDCGSRPEAALAWVVVPPAGCGVQASELPPGAVRVAATAGGTTTITTRLTLTIR